MKKHLAKILLVLTAVMLLAGCTGGGGSKEKYDLAGKTYYNTADEYDTYNPSKLWFGKDGSFVLTDNFYDGLYEISGKWALKEDVVTLTVEKTGIGEFKTILLEVKDDNTLVLKTELAGSRSDTKFSTEKPAPTATSPEPTSGTTTTGDPEMEYIAYYNASQGKGKSGSFVEFHDDGTFTFVEIQGLGATEIKGLWGVEGNMILFSNFEQVPYDHAGNPVHNFEMEMYDEDTLILQRGLESSSKGDIFTISGTIPEALKGKTGYTYNKFIHESTTEVADDRFLPVIEFFADGTFVFTENCYAGMGQYKGTYEKTDIGYVCYVEDASTMQGFAGQDVKTISFENYDAALILLQTDLCMSRKGDKFFVALGS